MLGFIFHFREFHQTFITSTFVKNNPLRVVFSLPFSGFGNLMKRCLSFLIYYFKEIHIRRLPLTNAKLLGSKQILLHPILQHFCWLFSLQSSSYLHWSIVEWGGQFCWRGKSGHCPTLAVFAGNTESKE